MSYLIVRKYKQSRVGRKCPHFANYKDSIIYKIAKPEEKLFFSPGSNPRTLNYKNIVKGIGGPRSKLSFLQIVKIQHFSFHHIFTECRYRFCRKIMVIQSKWGF